MDLYDENWNNVWWTPSESHKASRCSPIGRHNIARVLIQDNGLVKVLLVPSEEQRQIPTVTPWGACSQGRADPVRRGIAPKAAQPRNYRRIESNLGWDKWR